LSITEKVREFLMGNLATFEDDLELADGDNFFELGFVDSSFAMQLVSFVEEEFDITVTNEDLDLVNFSSIKRIVQFIEKKKN